MASSDPESHRIRLMSWNIDGLDPGNIETRTKAVCAIIRKENPTVVFLQEVVPQTLQILESGCPDYQILEGGKDGYFTAILLKVGYVTLEDHDIHMFDNSKMMRNILTATCRVKGVPFRFMTSHLESMGPSAGVRKQQLMTAFRMMRDTEENRTVVFGGDLNLRDKEFQRVADVGRLPENVLDLWEVTGELPDAKFTWDLRRNDNKIMPGNNQPFLRFDRLYLRQSEPKEKVKPVNFELIGLERVPSCQRFPSDHWGLLVHFNIQ